MTKKCVKCVKIGTEKALHLPLQTSKSHEVARVSGEKYPRMAPNGTSTVEFSEPRGARAVPVEFRVV